MPYAYDNRKLAFAYIRRSIYASQLTHFLPLFPAMLVLTAEELFDQTQPTLERITEYLGVEPFRLDDSRAANAGSYADDCPIRMELEAFFRPHNERLNRMLSRVFWPSLLRTGAVGGGGTSAASTLRITGNSGTGD